MLIIEVDGLKNHWEKVSENDRKREEALKEIGFAVLRFDDNDILKHINNVVYHIENYINKFKETHSKSSP